MNNGQYIRSDFEGADGSIIGRHVEAENPAEIEVALLGRSALVVWTSLTTDQITEIIWKYNNGLLCESRVITEEEYDNL